MSSETLPAAYTNSISLKTACRHQDVQLRIKLSGYEGCKPEVNPTVGLTKMALLGVLAQKTGERIEWDNENMKVANMPELNQYTKEPVRQGWRMGEELWT